MNHLGSFGRWATVSLPEGVVIARLNFFLDSRQAKFPWYVVCGVQAVAKDPYRPRQSPNWSMGDISGSRRPLTQYVVTHYEPSLVAMGYYGSTQ